MLFLLIPGRKMNVRNLVRSVAMVCIVGLTGYGCSTNTEPTTSTAPNSPSQKGSSINGSGGGADAVFDIPTPSVNGGTVSDDVNDGYFCVHVTWQSNAPGYADGYTSYAQDPTAPTDLNGGHGWEFWGNTQLAIVQTTPSGNANYSGHYEVYRDGVKLDDVTGNSYDDCGLEPGTYVYTIKAKSREREPGGRSDLYTHHSETSEGYEVVVEDCEEVSIDPSFAVNPYAGGNGGWNTAGSEWTANSSGLTANRNISFRMYQWTRTQNSCTDAITSTVVDGGYTGDVYLSRDGGTTWRKAKWSTTGNYYQSNGNYVGGNGSGLGVFTVTGDYNIHWTTDPLDGVMGVLFILRIP